MCRRKARVLYSLQPFFRLKYTGDRRLVDCGTSLAFDGQVLEADTELTRRYVGRLASKEYLVKIAHQITVTHCFNKLSNRLRISGIVRLVWGDKFENRRKWVHDPFNWLPEEHGS